MVKDITSPCVPAVGSLRAERHCRSRAEEFEELKCPRRDCSRFPCGRPAHAISDATTHVRARSMHGLTELRSSWTGRHRAFPQPVKLLPAKPCDAILRIANWRHSVRFPG